MCFTKRLIADAPRKTPRGRRPAYSSRRGGQGAKDTTKKHEGFDDAEYESRQ
jgi:hypothetical protein